MKNTNGIRVMPAGTATSSAGVEMTFTKDDLEEIASNYDAENHPAPLVIGHPKSNEPALGWIKSLKVVGNQLMGIPHKVSDKLKEHVKKAEFIKVSPSIFKRDSTANPHKGNLSLRHLGLLGAGAPAMPNGVLNPDDFSEDDEDMCFDFSIEEGNEYFKPRKEEMKITKEDKVDLSADFAEMKEKLRKSEEANALLVKQADEREIEEFSSKLITGGNILPSHKEKVCNILKSLDSMPTADFSDGNSPRELIKGFLEEIKVFDFNEKSQDDEPEVPSVDFVSPQGSTVDQDSMNRLAKAEKIAKEQKISLIEASKQVGE